MGPHLRKLQPSIGCLGAVFSAYTPGLEIIHRAGRVHSNIDPLSRLPRAAPDHTSPEADSGPSIITDSSLIEEQERTLNRSFTKQTFVAWSIKDCVDSLKSTWINETSGEDADLNVEESEDASSQALQDNDELDTLPVSEEYWEASNPALNLHVEMDAEFIESWVKDYESDQSFSSIWGDKKRELENWKQDGRFLKDQRGLLFFLNEDYQPRLCVPKARRNFILREAHENPLESVHAGPERLWQSLSQKFYWKRMKANVLEYCRSCDACQKTKFGNFNKFGFLIPNPIPTRPYQSISMDFIVNLPWSNNFNAIFAVLLSPPQIPAGLKGFLGIPEDSSGFLRTTL